MKIVTYLLIVFPVLWALLAIKHFWWRHREVRREQRRWLIRSKKIPEILFTTDLLDPDSGAEISVEKRKSRLTNSSCPICLENFEKQIKIKLLSCEHGFHTECLGPRIAEHNDSCPICRQTIKLLVEDEEPRSGCRFPCHCPLWRVRNEEELNQPLLLLNTEEEKQDENHGATEESCRQDNEEQGRPVILSLQNY